MSDPVVPVGGMVCELWLQADEASCVVPETVPSSWADLALEFASEVLWALAGRRHGLCTATIRPCRRDLIPGGWHQYGTPWTPVLYNGEWINVCSHRGGCGCDQADEIPLPGNMTNVSGVKIDGAAFTDWKVQDNGRGLRLLVRTDGNLWPLCQNIAADDTELGTWSVETVFGEPIPAGGKIAVDELFCELIKAKAGKVCNLPRRVTDVVRQGITFTLLDPQDFLREGRVGLYLCDLFLSTVNPEKLPMRSRAFNPDDYGPRSDVAPVIP